MASIRTGRRNGHTLYLQLGDEADDEDLFVGSAITPEVASLVADAATCGLGHHPAILDDFVGTLPPDPGQDAGDQDAEGSAVSAPTGQTRVVGGREVPVYRTTAGLGDPYAGVPGDPYRT